MIISFRCKQTQALFDGGHPRQFRALEAVATRKLTQLDSAVTLEFLRSPPGNRLEALKGRRRSVQHSRQRSVANLFQVGERTC